MSFKNQLIIFLLISLLALIYGIIQDKDIFIVLSLLFLIFGFYYFIRKAISVYKAKSIFIPDFYNQYEDLLKIFDELSETEKSKNYINKEKRITINEKVDITNLVLKKHENYIKYINDDSIRKDIENSNSIIKEIQDKIPLINSSYFDYQLTSYSHILDTIEKYPLDEMQKKAIFNPEKNILVIAGAGSGKTSTIVGKVKYLFDVKKVKKEEILLISFTSASAKEMKERIKEKIGSNMDVMTFHKLGLNIIQQSSQRKISVTDDNDMKIFKEDIYSNLIYKINEYFPELFSKFFFYLLQPNKSYFDFETMGEYEDYRRRKKLSTIREKGGTTSITGEYLKSMEEVEIANFLFMNGINYTYEKLYEINTSNPEYKQYAPDFYLDDYGIYIEHFGIDANGNVPKFFGDGLGGYSEANKRYKEGITWKKNIHKENNTKLICTYSYEKQACILVDNLKENLLNYGVILKNLTQEEIINKILPSVKADYSNFIQLILTFLNLYKSRGMNFKSLNSKLNELNLTVNQFKRGDIFILIFEKLYKYYSDYLSSIKKIDFNDMINDAKNLVQNNKVDLPYKYIIIDEFQDIGYGRYDFIKSILNKNNAELFCVGDDWQSIYRFTGGDLNIFTHFNRYFSFGEKVFINKTYRYPQKVNDVTYKFIMKNPAQVEKKLQSGNLSTPEEPIFNIISYEDEIHKKQILDMILLKYKKGIIALGRNNSENKDIPEGIAFLTVHKSKGLEADYVIILNGNKGVLGFPNENENDYLLNLVLSNTDNYKFSEERRLFYVALTRARKKVFILTEEGKKSSFVSELEEILGTQAEKVGRKVNLCPRCKMGELVNNDSFAKGALRCSKYPLCDYTIRTIGIAKKDKGLPFAKMTDKYLNWYKETFRSDKIIQYSVYYEKEKRNKMNI